MKRNGLAQIPLMIGLLLMAVAIPVATKLVQTNQENRGKAASSCGTGVDSYYYGHPCCKGYHATNCTGSGSYAVCDCEIDSTNPTATPGYRNCTVRTCGSGKCNSQTKYVPSNQACPATNCTSDADCVVATSTPKPTGGVLCTNDGICKSSTLGSSCCSGNSYIDATCPSTKRCGILTTCTTGGLCKTASLPCCGGVSFTDTSCPGTSKRCTGSTTPTVTPGACTPGGQCKTASVPCCDGVSMTDLTCPNTNKICTGGSACTPGGQCKISSKPCCGGVSMTDLTCPNTNKICTGPVSTPTVGPTCINNGLCKKTGVACCSGYAATVATSVCSTGKKCASPPTQPTNTPAPPSNCTDNGLCKKSGVPCCSGNVKVVETSVCASGKKCVAAAPTNTPPPGACTECPKTFSCYQNGTVYKWYATGMPKTGFTKVDDSKCTGINKPTFKGKIKGDADCTGIIDLEDVSIWRAEYISGNKGEVKKNNWLADFNCLGTVDLVDRSIWRDIFTSKF